jgi:hypothetical protein
MGVIDVAISCSGTHYACAGRAPLKVLIFLVLTLFSLASIHAQSKVQCSCPKIPADGEGNTSCSAAESGDHCTIDFNLFGRESEKRAADLLARYGGGDLKLPDLDLSPDESLQSLSLKGGQELQDAILIHIAVAAGDQKSRLRDGFPPSSFGELVRTFRSNKAISQLIEVNFSLAAREEWSKYSNEDLRASKKKVPTETVGETTVSPGCIEFKVGESVWMMFKVKWSPARIKPRCSDSAQ